MNHVITMMQQVRLGYMTKVDNHQWRFTCVSLHYFLTYCRGLEGLPSSYFTPKGILESN